MIDSTASPLTCCSGSTGLAEGLSVACGGEPTVAAAVSGRLISVPPGELPLRADLCARLFFSVGRVDPAGIIAVSRGFAEDGGPRRGGVGGEMTKCSSSGGGTTTTGLATASGAAMGVVTAHVSESRASTAGGKPGGLPGSAAGWLELGQEGGDAAVGAAGKPVALSNGTACASLCGSGVAGLLSGGSGRREGLGLPRRVFVEEFGILTLVPQMVSFSCAWKRQVRCRWVGQEGCARCWPGRL